MNLDRRGIKQFLALVDDSVEADARESVGAVYFIILADDRLQKTGQDIGQLLGASDVEVMNVVVDGHAPEIDGDCSDMIPDR